MALRDLLATASSQGGDAPSWSWYVPLGLTAVVTAGAWACVHFRRTLMRWAPVLVELGAAAILVAAVAGVEGADELARSLAGPPAPKDFDDFMILLVFVVVWNLVVSARRRRRDDHDQGDGEP